MKVFITGATGFIGSRVVNELLRHGHQALGLARSEASVNALSAVGAEAHRGDLNDLESLRQGAEQADAVIHLAFDHDAAFSGGASSFAEVCEKDRRVIETLGSALVGSDRPLLITSGTPMGNPAPGQISVEDHFDPHHPNPRKATEEAGAALLERGVNVSVVRLPQVHDPVKQGLVTYLIQFAREKGEAAYVGEGIARWPAAHVEDVARLYRLALEKGEPGRRYHAVAEEAVLMRDIVTTFANGLNVPVVSVAPEEAPAYFGWLSLFAGFDMPASSAATREALGWTPTGPGMIADLENMNYR